MIHGYSSERVGCYITHITGFDNIVMEEMTKQYFRYDNGMDNDLASFIHLVKEERDRFISDFDIILVESKEELKLLKKMISGT